MINLILMTIIVFFSKSALCEELNLLEKLKKIEFMLSMTQEKKVNTNEVIAKEFENIVIKKLIKSIRVVFKKSNNKNYFIAQYKKHRFLLFKNEENQQYLFTWIPSKKTDISIFIRSLKFLKEKLNLQNIDIKNKKILSFRLNYSWLSEIKI